MWSTHCQGLRRRQHRTEHKGHTPNPRIGIKSPHPSEKLNFLKKKDLYFQMLLYLFTLSFPISFMFPFYLIYTLPFFLYLFHDGRLVTITLTQGTCGREVTSLSLIHLARVRFPVYSVSWLMFFGVFPQLSAKVNSRKFRPHPSRVSFGYHHHHHHLKP